MSVTEIDSTRKIQKSLYRTIKNVNYKKNETGKKIIGVTMLTNNKKNQLFAVKALYEDESNNPYMIKVEAIYEKENEAKVIDVRKVNPKEASLVEIFALCSYCDDKNISDGSAFGSFRELKNYIHKAISLDAFLNKKTDWEKQIEIIKKDFLQEGLFYQYQSCLQLLDIFDYAKIIGEIKEEEDTTKSEIKIQEWKKESNNYKDVRDAVAMLMKKELFQ